MGGGTTFTTASAQPGLTAPPSAGTFLDGTGAERSFTGGPLNLGPRSILLPSGKATNTEDVPPVLDEDFSSALVPGLRPSLLRPEGGVNDGGVSGGEALAAGPTGWVPSTADLADALFGAGGGARYMQRVCDACFSEGLGGAESPSSGQGLAPAALAALGLLAGHRAAQQAEAEERTRRHSLI
jgi:hypothetical protein